LYICVCNIFSIPCLYIRYTKNIVNLYKIREKRQTQIICPKNENKWNKRGNNPNKISSMKIMHKRIILNPNLKEDNVPVKAPKKFIIKEDK